MTAEPKRNRRSRPPRNPERYLLRLYVTGTTGKSVRAIQSVRRICEEHLQGFYDLEVVDLYKNLPLARGDQIIAAPTLIKRLPQPLRRLIGDMSDEQRVLVGLDLRPRRALKKE
jgi:circadian clock protein KaiB